MKQSQADMSTRAYAERSCVCLCACVFIRKKKKKMQCTGSGFVLPQSLLFASSVDTLLLLTFCGVTFVRFMRYTDWLVHTMQIRLVKNS